MHIEIATQIKSQHVGNKAKRRISKRVFQENKAHQIFQKMNISYLLIRTHTCAYPEKWTFLTFWYAHLRVRIKGNKCSLFGKFGVLCFLEAPVLRFPLLPYHQIDHGILWLNMVSMQLNTIQTQSLRWNVLFVQS